MLATSAPLVGTELTLSLSVGARERPLLLCARMNAKQLYRMRAPASGREALAHAEPGSVYVDRETDEEMVPVAAVLPLAPSASSLPRSPENLRACRRCDQLIGARRQRLPLLRALRQSGALSLPALRVL